MDRPVQRLPLSLPARPTKKLFWKLGKTCFHVCNSPQKFTQTLDTGSWKGAMGCTRLIIKVNKCFNPNKEHSRFAVEVVSMRGVRTGKRRSIGGRRHYFVSKNARNNHVENSGMTSRYECYYCTWLLCQRHAERQCGYTADRSVMLLSVPIMVYTIQLQRWLKLPQCYVYFFSVYGSQKHV